MIIFHYQQIYTNGFKWDIVLQLVLIFIWILVIAIHVIRNYKDQRVIYWGWIIALILVSLQVITGMFVVLTKLNLIYRFTSFFIYFVIIRFIMLYDFTIIQKSITKIRKWFYVQDCPESHKTNFLRQSFL